MVKWEQRELQEREVIEFLSKSKTLTKKKKVKNFIMNILVTLILLLIFLGVFWLLFVWGRSIIDNLIRNFKIVFKGI